jgi:hypothetical protein
MLQALRAEDALAIAEVARRRSRDEQAMTQYLGIGRGGARAKGAPLDGTLLCCPDAVDLAAFESEEGRRLETAIAQLSPDARRELIALIWLVQRPLLSFEAALRRTRRSPAISWAYGLSATSPTGFASSAAAARDRRRRNFHSSTPSRSAYLTKVRSS